MGIKPNKDRVIYLLIGPKGCGKTYIGILLERCLNIEFLKVEPSLIKHIALTGSKSEQLVNDGYDLEEKWIGDILLRKDEVVSEATGSSKYLTTFIQNLSAKYSVKLIRIKCPLNLCFERVKARSTINQFAMTDEQIKSINELSHNVQLDWDIEIDNAGSMSESDIVAVFNRFRIASLN